MHMCYKLYVSLKLEILNNLERICVIIINNYLFCYQYAFLRHSNISNIMFHVNRSDFETRIAGFNYNVMVFNNACLQTIFKKYFVIFM